MKLGRNESGDDEAHSRYGTFWDLYFLVVLLVVAIALVVIHRLTPGHRLTALGAVAAMAVLHLAAGRRLVRSNAQNLAALLVLLGQVALFAVAVQFADTRMSPERGWFHRATSKESVPGATPSRPPFTAARVKMAPTSGRRCSAATIAFTLAGSPART